MKILFIILLWISILPRNDVKPVITIVRIGNISNYLILRVASNIENILNVRIVIKNIDTLPGNSYIHVMSTERDAGKIVDWLETIYKGRTIAITDQNLFDVSYQQTDFAIYIHLHSLYGYAGTLNKKSIVSVSGMDTDCITSQLTKVAIHELGHTYGLNHCPNVLCIMNIGDGTNKSIDEAIGLCKNCSNYLKSCTLND